MDHPCGYWICRNSVNKRNAKSCGDSLNADLYPIHNEDVSYIELILHFNLTKTSFLSRRSYAEMNGSKVNR